MAGRRCHGRWHRGRHQVVPRCWSYRTRRGAICDQPVGPSVSPDMPLLPISGGRGRFWLRRVSGSRSPELPAGSWPPKIWHWGTLRAARSISACVTYRLRSGNVCRRDLNPSSHVGVQKPLMCCEAAARRQDSNQIRQLIAEARCPLSSPRTFIWSLRRRGAARVHGKLRVCLRPRQVRRVPVNETLLCPRWASDSDLTPPIPTRVEIVALDDPETSGTLADPEASGAAVPFCANPPRHRLHRRRRSSLPTKPRYGRSAWWHGRPLSAPLAQRSGR